MNTFWRGALLHVADRAVHKKNLPENREIYYMDGLVSTGKINSLYNIRYYFINTKKNWHKNYQHFKKSFVENSSRSYDPFHDHVNNE
jgi:hypothetical protein